VSESDTIPRYTACQEALQYEFQDRWKWYSKYRRRIYWPSACSYNSRQIFEIVFWIIFWFIWCICPILLASSNIIPLSRSNLGLVLGCPPHVGLLIFAETKHEWIHIMIYILQYKESLNQMICHKSKPCPFFTHAVSMTTQFFLYYRKSNPNPMYKNS